jgi:hypothetical protein
MRLLFAPLAAALVLAGCVTVPVGPSVMVMPGSQKNLDQFQIDEAACRNHAQSIIGGPNAGLPARDAAAANAAAGTLLGAAAGAIIGSASGQAGPGAALGAGTGLLVGSAAGSDVAGYSSRSLQRSYDVAYMQCMYARGNQVPGRVAYRGRSSTYPPPNYPPPTGYPPSGYPPPASYPPSSYPPPNYPPPANLPPRG